MTVEPETMQGLLTAFNLAFNYVTRHPHEFSLTEQAAQEELIVIISKLAKLGEDNPIILAELAIGELRKR